MGWDILEQEYDANRKRYERACFYDDTTDWAFGPVTDDLERFATSREALLAFATAIGGNPRASRSQAALRETWDAWCEAARAGIEEHSAMHAGDVVSEQLGDGWRVTVTPEFQRLLDDHAV